MVNRQAVRRSPCDSRANFRAGEKIKKNSKSSQAGGGGGAAPAEIARH
jgi:hypothetical protein